MRLDIVASLSFHKGKHGQPIAEQRIPDSSLYLKASTRYLPVEKCVKYWTVASSSRKHFSSTDHGEPLSPAIIQKQYFL